MTCDDCIHKSVCYRRIESVSTSYADKCGDFMSEQGSTYGGVSWGGTYKSQQLSDNAISRQAVLDCLTATKLKKLPSVNPQPKMGKWIKSRDMYGNYHFTCPFCEHDIVTAYDGTWKDNFCPNCGANMKSEEANDKKKM